MIKRTVYKAVQWKTKLTEFTGRNGLMKCAGIEFMRLADPTHVMIMPTTSKGKAGRCDITVPTQAIPEIIEALEAFLKEGK